MQVLESIEVEIDGEFFIVERLEDGTFRKPSYLAGAEREVIGRSSRCIGPSQEKGFNGTSTFRESDWQNGNVITAPVTDAAKQWSGFGSNLAPAWEPICVARKPLACATIASNVLEYGTGALNIDACRIPIDPEFDDPGLGGNGTWSTEKMAKNVYNGGYAGLPHGSSELGRWPKNVLIENSEEVLAEFAKYGKTKSKAAQRGAAINSSTFKSPEYESTIRGHNDAGTAARFFYSAKASQRERNENGENKHNTVKPVSLMTFLCKLVTQPGGLILDPFSGSGSTGVAALRSKFRFVGMELLEEHIMTSTRRLEDADREVEGLPKIKIGKESDIIGLPLFA